jgi:phosphonate transport system substrate-binding protein
MWSPLVDCQYNCKDDAEGTARHLHEVAWMESPMKCLTCTLLGSLVVVAVACLLWSPRDAAPVPVEHVDAALDGAPLRLGLIPERDIIQQRRRYRALADYLEARLHRPVELVTMSTYTGVFTDLAEERIDAAFLGSLVTVLAYERYGAQVLVKPEYLDGTSSYHGVIFVRDDSPIRTLDDLQPADCLAMVRATLAGHLFPASVLLEMDRLEGEHAARVCWIGSHDEVIAAVAEGRVAIGAAKDLRIDAYERANPDVRFRRLMRSGEVPENALVLAAGTSPDLARELVAILLNMPDDPDGPAALRQLGMRRFILCDIADYHVVYGFIETLRPHWDKLGIQGPAPAADPKPVRHPE